MHKVKNSINFDTIYTITKCEIRNAYNSILKNFEITNVSVL